MSVAASALVLGLSPAAPWLTRAERTGFRETSRYEETLEDCRRLEHDSRWIRCGSFGRSPEGRELMLIVASKDRAFTPEAAARAARPVVLIQAGIHAGEIDGKDAGIMLLRDIAVTRERQELLDNVTLLFLPIYNVDGHERFGPYNRINQNGPAEMGWRTNSRNLNLNRDYMKADAAETRAWLALYTSWWPDLMIDCHVTDGADYRHDITYAWEPAPAAAPSLDRWLSSAIGERAMARLEQMGHLPSPYIWPIDSTDLRAGLLGLPFTPRFANGYTVLQNRPSFLIETHMLKDYRTRVTATYDTLRALLEEVNRDPASLREAVRQADEAAARPGRVVLRVGRSETSRPDTIKGLEYTRELSEISGGVRVEYSTRPVDIPVQRFDVFEPELSVDKPAAYILGPQWTEAIDRLRLHGLSLRRLTETTEVSVEGYRLTDASWAQRPFEGRHPVTFTAERIAARPVAYPAGSVVVPLDQRSSAVAVHLLEPEAPDSLASWGFFDAAFERKEYAEAYVLEDLARKMMEEDPSLRGEFEAALQDAAFAGDPGRRLEFFYRRSPWWDDTAGLYPVGILPAAVDLPLEPVP